MDTGIILDLISIGTISGPNLVVYLVYLLWLIYNQEWILTWELAFICNLVSL